MLTFRSTVPPAGFRPPRHERTTADLTNLTQRPVYVVFNGNAPQATAALAQATEIVRSMGLQTAPFELSERAIYRHANGGGEGGH